MSLLTDVFKKKMGKDFDNEKTYDTALTLNQEFTLLPLNYKMCITI